MPDPPASPVDAEARARAALCAHPQGVRIASGRFLSLAGGHQNHAWRVDVEIESYFVRLGTGQATRLGADWSSEGALLELTSRAGLAPPLVLCDPTRALLVMRFIAGRAWTREAAVAPENLARIGQMLNVLHHLEPRGGIRKVDFERQARHYEQQLCRPGALAALDAAELARFQSEAGGVFTRLQATRGRACVCHNDLHHRNVVDTGARLWFVDWEYGGLGDPVFDLAGYMSYHALDPGQRRDLLAAYGEETDWQRLGDAQWAFDYVQWLWYRVAATGNSTSGSGMIRG